MVACFIAAPAEISVAEIDRIHHRMIALLAYAKACCRRSRYCVTLCSLIGLSLDRQEINTRIIVDAIERGAVSANLLVMPSNGDYA
jgi:hypothetical protein